MISDEKNKNKRVMMACDEVSPWLCYGEMHMHMRATILRRFINMIDENQYINATTMMNR